MKKNKKKKIYDDAIYNTIYDLYLKGKYNVAKRYLFEYLEKYPWNINAKILLSKVLMALKEYSEAEKLLKYCIDKYPKHYVFIQNLVYLYMELEEYEKAYDWYKKLDFEEYRKINDKNTSELAALHVFLQIKLGQCKEYSEESAINHILERHVEKEGKQPNVWTKELENGITLEEYIYLFEKHQDIKELIEKISKRIETAEKEPTIDIVDSYYFKYENIGKSQNTYTDILKVVTIKNTNKIITMFPCEKTENIKIINELEEKKEYRTNKVRTRKSQIDKFKERYNDTIDLK